MKRLIYLIPLFLAFSGASSAQKLGKMLTLEPYKFENSKKETVDAELGRLKVPENRDDPESRLIEIAFVRFKSTSPKPGAPIVYLAGGPGGSGVDSAKHGRFGLFMEMRKFGDVIALDQRGVGLSEPNLECPGKLDLPLDEPMSKESLLKRAKALVAECAQKWKSRGVDVRGYNTVQSAEDLEDVRRAIGAKKLRLWGISYGTHLGLAAIRLHPESIESAVLAGVEAMDDTLKLPAATDALIDELSLRAKEDANFKSYVPDLKLLIQGVLDKLNNKPATVGIKDAKTGKSASVTIGAFDVEYLTAQATGDSYALSLFPALYLGMAKGNFDFVARQVFQLRTGQSISLMSVAMDCASGATQERINEIRKQAAESVLSDVINAPYPEICDALPDLDLGNDFRKPVTSEVPVLFMSGTLDGRTPPGNAEAVLKGFSNGKHLVIEGASHSDDLFLSTPKIAETMSLFFGGKPLPDKILVATEKPFAFRKP